MPIRISKPTDKYLTKIARLTGRTKASIARQAIETYLPIFEEIDREERRLARTHGRKTRITLNAFFERRGLPW
jgi:predicted DNA-binding protein